METLCFLDKFVKEGQFGCGVGCDLRIFIPIVVDEFLEKTVLISWVLDETVDQP